jgi:hypothetical protein
MPVQPVVDEVEMLLEGAWIATEVEEIAEREVHNEYGSGGGVCYC